mgnify:FL=1
MLFRSKDVDCDLILAMGNWAMSSLVPEAKGPLPKNRGRWWEVNLGGRRRLVRVTFSCNFIESNSIYHHEVDARGRVSREERLNYPGTCGWFFQRDLKAV